MARHAIERQFAPQADIPARFSISRGSARAPEHYPTLPFARQQWSGEPLLALRRGTDFQFWN